LTHSLPFFPPFDASFDGLDATSNRLLNEVGGEIGFLTELVVERVPCGCVGRNALGIGAVGPAELGGAVGAVKELPGGFVEVVASLVGDGEFDRGSTSDLYISDVVLTVLKYLGVRQL